MKNKIKLDQETIDVLRIYTEKYATKEEKKRFLTLLESRSGVDRWVKSNYGPPTNEKKIIRKKAKDIWACEKAFKQTLVECGWHTKKVVACTLNGVLFGSLNLVLNDLTSFQPILLLVYSGEGEEVDVHPLYIDDYNFCEFGLDFWNSVGKRMQCWV